MGKPATRALTNHATKTSNSDPLARALHELNRFSTSKDLANLKRFAITAHEPFGVSMLNMRAIAKRLGKNHELALALWDTERYEARMLATLVDEPERVTAQQMDKWCRDFDNWAICDTACFCLFDRTPHAWTMLAKWRTRTPEFEKRAAFALLWSLSRHDRTASDRQFVQGLQFVELAATDERNFVKKAVNMALRAVGKRNRSLRLAARETARRLAASDDPTARWIGKDALRALT